MRMIVLAAGRGTRLRPITDTRPKCLVELGNKSLLDWQLETAHEAGIDDVVIVGGYQAHQLERLGTQLVLNPSYDSTNMVSTLFCAEHLFGDGFIMSYGDIVFNLAVLETLLAEASPIGVVVDLDWLAYWEMRFDDPLSDAESLLMDPQGHIRCIGQRESDIDRITAQYIGLVAFRGEGVGMLRQAYAVAQEAEEAGQLPFNGSRPLSHLYMTDLLQGMIDLNYPVRGVPIRGGWVEIDRRRDLKLAERLLSEGRLA